MLLPRIVAVLATLAVGAAHGYDHEHDACSRRGHDRYTRTAGQEEELDSAAMMVRPIRSNHLTLIEAVAWLGDLVSSFQMPELACESQ